MKLAYFTDTYLPNRDGVVTSMLNFRRELEKRGHEVYVFSPGTKEAKKANTDKNVFLYTSTAFKPYPDYKIALFPFFSSSKVKELGIDIVHNHGLATMGLAAYAAKRRLALPSLWSFHTLIPEATHYLSRSAFVKRLASRAAWRYLQWYRGLFPVATAPSRYTQSILTSHGIATDFLPNGIDTKRFINVDSSFFKSKYDLEGKTVFLHVGRLVHEKNIDLLIDAALIVREEVPDAVFAVVGSGPLMDYYTKRVKRAGLARFFVFTGFLPDQMLPEAYSACDVFAFPSRFETQGLVALEAMACGKPVACAADSAASELIDEGKNGISFKDNADDCADALIQAAQNSAKLGRNARKRALAYSVEKCTDRLLDLYESIL